MIEAKLLIDGQWVSGATTLPVVDKFSRQSIAQVAAADQVQVNAAVAAAREAFRRGGLSPYQRYEILMKAAAILQSRADAIVALMVAETGFTVADNRSDFARCVQTLLTSAEEAKRITGEMIPIDAAPGHDGELAFTIRVPLGVVCAITPFNSPLNTVAHKVAPAIAAGNSVVLKPASYTPLSAIELCKVLIEAGLPRGWINLVTGPGGAVGRWLVENQDIRYYAFTGGEAAGRAIQQGAGLRRTQMELGNISATIVCADADLKFAVPKCAGTAFRKAGQVCTSLQRLYVHETVLQQFTDRLVAETRGLKTGDPRAEGTVVGPMIDPKEAERAQLWVKEAATAGAQVLIGGSCDNTLMAPTVLTGVTAQMKVMREEIFAPVVCVVPFREIDAAIAAVNATPFGLSAGIFTSNIDTALRAARAVEVGLFNINQTSSNRADPMPYGGCKDSGFGREGPRYAIRDMTDERLITITPTSTPTRQ